ncbi:hypothetical protein [Microbacterium sp. CIAB417]|uniref:hypothetical protein n=1 Tax=Microbacterium sp. CIAB417 TaxID=2860287 RepID=UPI001FAD7A97|nr:hypothetical protein [Microbacterium sp. CIAB417]
MRKIADAPSPELVALIAQERLPLAARTLVSTFTPKLGGPYPACSRMELAEFLAEHGQVPKHAYTWRPDRFPDGALARLVIELVLLWERAGLAARGMSYEIGEVVLLDAGEAALRQENPHAAVLAALGAR